MSDRTFQMSRGEFLSLFGGLLAVPNALGSAAGPEHLPPSRCVTRGPRHHWRGYYDKLLFDPSNRLLLANEVDFEGRSPTAADSIRVGYVDMQDGDTWHEIGTTSAWNWQQGCMLQWRPGKRREIVWNDRIDDAFVCHLLDVDTGKRRTIPSDLYTLAPDGTWAITTDFRRLNDVRPGYGYAGVPDPNRAVLLPEDSGIWKVDLETGRRTLLISIADAAKIPYTGAPERAFKKDSKHWFNHLLVNPDGSRFLFLHRWRAPGDRTFFTRMFTADADGTNLYVVDPHGGTSHFVWRDPSHIMAWAWHPSHGERFYVYEDRTENVAVIGPDVMIVNGHNTYVPGTNNECVLNDTYPDKERLQHVYLYHVPTGRRVPVGDFPSPLAYAHNEWRCDTHPSASRDGRLVSIDSPHDGGRQVYVIDIAGLTRGG